MSMWVCFWGICTVSLICGSVFVHVLYVLITVALCYSLKFVSLISPALSFFLQIALERGFFFFWFHRNFRIIRAWSCYLKGTHTVYILQPVQ